MSAPSSSGQAGSGQAGLCLATGTAMLGVPAVLELITAPPPDSSSAATVGLVAALVLAVGAGAVALATVRPAFGGFAALAVLCALLALVLARPEPWADGLCGLATLAFLLAVRLHALALRGPVDVGRWLLARRPMLVGAGVTTPAAVVAAAVPTELSLPVAGIAGALVAAVGAVVLTR